jgi:hypothetical protein
MATENADTDSAEINQADESIEQDEETGTQDDEPRRRPPAPAPAGAAVDDEDDFDELEDMEFMLDEIENRIAPLA